MADFAHVFQDPRSQPLRSGQIIRKRDLESRDRSSRHLAPWSHVLARVMAGDPGRLPALLLLPVRDVVLAYHQLVQQEARMEWRLERLMWASGVRFNGRKECPAMPDVLKD